MEIEGYYFLTNCLANARELRLNIVGVSNWLRRDFEPIGKRNCYVETRGIKSCCRGPLAGSDEHGCPGSAARFRPFAETGSTELTPVTFVFDEGQQALVSATEGLAFLLQQDSQGNLLFVDPNGNPWVALACCAVGQVDTDQGPVTVVDGILWENTGV
jgi:hypothetical protein